MAEDFKNPKTDLYKYLQERGLESEIEAYEKLQQHQQQVTKSNLEDVLTKIAGFMRKWVK